MSIASARQNHSSQNGWFQNNGKGCISAPLTFCRVGSDVSEPAAKRRARQPQLFLKCVNWMHFCFNDIFSNTTQILLRRVPMRSECLVEDFRSLGLLSRENLRHVALTVSKRFAWQSWLKIIDARYCNLRKRHLLVVCGILSYHAPQCYQNDRLCAWESLKPKWLSES